MAIDISDAAAAHRHPHARAAGAGPRRRLLRRRHVVPGRDRHELRRASRRGARDRRRVRLRQDAVVDVPHRACCRRTGAPAAAPSSGDRELIGMSAQQAAPRSAASEIAMIFQEPMTALNPVFTIGFQIVETLRTHFDIGPEDARVRALELLRLVEIPNPETADRRVPAPAVRRSAPARDDRPGAGVRPEAAHRRRADDGPRRHGPGRDPQAHARPALAHRLGHRADHPRHGRRRRHGRHDDRDEGRPGRRAG